MVIAGRDRDCGGWLVGGALGLAMFSFANIILGPHHSFRIPSLMMIMEVQLLGAANDHHWHIIIGTYPSSNVPRFSTEDGFPL